MKNIATQAGLLIQLMSPIKKALLENDISTALKIIDLIEAMSTAAIDFDEPNQLIETAYDAKVALMEALSRDMDDAADKPESKNG